MDGSAANGGCAREMIKQRGETPPGDAFECGRAYTLDRSS